MYLRVLTELELMQAPTPVRYLHQKRRCYNGKIVDIVRLYHKGYYLTNQPYAPLYDRETIFLDFLNRKTTSLSTFRRKSCK